MNRVIEALLSRPERLLPSACCLHAACRHLCPVSCLLSCASLRRLPCTPARQMPNGATALLRHAADGKNKSKKATNKCKKEHELCALALAGLLSARPTIY